METKHFFLFFLTHFFVFVFCTRGRLNNTTHKQTNKQTKNDMKWIIICIEKRKVGSNWYVEVPEAERYSHIGRANPLTQTQPWTQPRSIRMAFLFLSPTFIIGGATWYWVHNYEPIWLDNSLYQWVEKEE